MVLILGYSCSEDSPIIPPPPPVVKDTITISVESFTHCSITLKVQSTANSPQSSIRVLRSFNNTTTAIAEYPIQTKDTTIIDDDNGTGLLLDTSYTYYAVRVDSLGTLKDTSNIVTQKTLAPTSHNYTWQEFTIGDAGFSNALYDVWGTDENNVWAVGTVMINDTAYGVLKWNGTEWKPALKRGGYNSILGFTNYDIWAVGNVIYHFDGISWNENRNQILNDNIPYTSIWGTSSSNLYLGNAWGKIIHWDGTKASVLASFYGTSINDISGLINEGFYVVGSKNTTNGNNIVTFYNFSSFQNYSDVSLLNTSPLTVKVLTDNFVLIGGNNLFTKNRSGWNTIPINNYGTVNKVRGDNTNNIFAVGFFKEAYHFNGLDWHKYSELSATHGVFNSVFVSGQRVFIVGQNETYNFAQIYIGVK